MSERLKGKTVLIADDDERNTYAIMSYMETYGMKIITAKDGRDALSALKQNDKVDIILMDMMMPEMDGYETIAAIKSNPQFSKVPVIAVTAKAMKGDKEKCMQAGAWDYIAKPLIMRELIEKMAGWIV